MCLFIPQKLERRDGGVETDDEPMDSDDISEKRRLPTFSDYFVIYPTQSGETAKVDGCEIHLCRRVSVIPNDFKNLFRKMNCGFPIDVCL